MTILSEKTTGFSLSAQARKATLTSNPLQLQRLFRSKRAFAEPGLGQAEKMGKVERMFMTAW